MGSATLAKVTAKSAHVVCEEANLSTKARKLLEADMTPPAFLERLIDAELFLDAIRFLSQALPHREAVFWACLCIRATLPFPRLPAAEQSALKSALTWVLAPTEPNRLATRAPAEKARLTAPAGCVAMAAFWSGGARPALAGRAVAAAVMVSAAIGLKMHLHARYRQFLSLGTGVANGEYSWDHRERSS